MTYTIFAVRHDGTPVEVHHPTLGHCLAWMNWRESVDHQVVLAADAPFQLWHGRELLTNRCRRQCSSLAPVLSGLSEPLEVLQQMIDELRPLAAHPSEAARVLLPEQMPVSLWEAISTIRSVAFGVIPCFDSHGYALTHPMEKAFSAAFGYGSSGPAYDGEGQCNARHAVHVAHALASGRWVPTEALQHYVDHGMPTDLAWASDLVHKPYLRGAFRSVDECSIVLTLLAQAGVHLDEASARKLVADLAAHNRYAVSNFVEGDNALYEAGWLSVRPLPVDKGQQVPPRSPLAEAVHREVLAENLKNGLRALEEERGRMSTREYLFRKGLLERAAASSDASWANRVADTVLTRNLAGMLSILDNSHNVASQRACEQHFGIKLRGLHARARRLAVFKLAGIEGARAVAEAESNLDAADAAAKLQKRLEVSRKRLENHVVRNGAETYTGDEWVRHLMASGYTKLVERKTGASVRYFLVDHEGSGWALSVARGFYDYAVLCLDALEAAKTVPQPSA